MEGLLKEINRQLSDQGLYIKSGEVRIIDVNVIEAKNCGPTKARQINQHKAPRLTGI
jgi:hypothetical protein